MREILYRFIGSALLIFMPTGRFPSLNRFLFRMMGVKIGPDAKVYSNVRFSRKLYVSIGRETFIGSRTTFVGGAFSRVLIGDYCDISDNVNFITGTHQIDLIGHRAAGEGFSKDIVVGNGVWIGYGSLILPGVLIGDHAVIAAGTVVYKNVSARTLVAGNPMKTIRSF